MRITYCIGSVWLHRRCIRTENLHDEIPGGTQANSCGCPNVADAEMSHWVGRLQQQQPRERARARWFRLVCLWPAATKKMAMRGRCSDGGDSLAHALHIPRPAYPPATASPAPGPCLSLCSPCGLLPNGQPVLSTYIEDGTGGMVYSHH